MPELTIGQLAEACDVGVETVRYYQRRGLMDVPSAGDGNTPGRRTRKYGEGALRKLRFIRSAQRAGFTLSEIGELIELDAGHDRKRARDLAEARIAALDEEIRHLRRSQAALRKLSHECASRDEGPCPILSSFETGDER